MLTKQLWQFQTTAPASNFDLGKAQDLVCVCSRLWITWVQHSVRRPVLFDCDAGVDDIFALVWICANQDKLDLAVVTAIPGNVEGNQTLSSAAAAMQFLGCGPHVTLGYGSDNSGRGRDGYMGVDGLMGLAKELKTIPQSHDAQDEVLGIVDALIAPSMDLPAHRTPQM